MTDKKVKLNLVGLDGNAFSLLADAKVGDWVDCKDLAGVHAQCKVLEILEHNVVVGCKSGYRWSLPHNNIIRKLSPSEHMSMLDTETRELAESLLKAQEEN